MELYFSDAFGVPASTLDDYGAFNISLVTDLPLFVDPFLLFNSSKQEYQQLHDAMIRYLRFLRVKSATGVVQPGLVRQWYRFSEVKQNWLGFCGSGNRGRGLGRDFANALNANLVDVFRDFGAEKVTRGSHIEKLCLIRSGVGRDMISDFTTNLIKGYLLRYTECFAQLHVAEDRRQVWSVKRTRFNYELECWMPVRFELPTYDHDYVILTPKDILTKDDTWISHRDMVNRFSDIPDAMEDAHLRNQVNNYFLSVLSQEPTAEELQHAVTQTLLRFPAIIDHYIRMKEDQGDDAVAHSALGVSESYQLYVKQFGQLAQLLHDLTAFFRVPRTTQEEARRKVEFLKDVIENKGGHRLFYVDGEPVRRESDLQILYRLVWHGTVSDVSREVNDGRGPADFKVSRGSADKTIVEFKLASNPQLRRNLQKQTEAYQKASDARTGLKVILFFTEAEELKVYGLLQELGMLSDPRVILIDARDDNKPSASKA